MPRVAKKTEDNDSMQNENNKVKKVAQRKTSIDKKTSSKKGSTKTATTNKTSKGVASKSKTDNKSVKNATNKKAKSVSTKKISSTRKKNATDDTPAILEYYDLPYRYNETVVKILAQTPSILFVYWDISDVDRNSFIEKYGEDFFNRTVPVLLIHNKSKNISYEVEINDFANSWYLRMQEPNCEYDIELRRKDINNSNQSLYLSSSNKLISPNDHVLFDETDFTRIKFRNVKTGSISVKDFGSIRLMSNIGNIYNKKHKVYRFYNDLYKDEVLDSNKMFYNPSSNPTSNVF